MLGRRIGSWILTKELGHGGMGSVFEARHASLGHPAAVKVLSPGLESEESFRQRFRREAELQAQLRHPNVARLLDYLEDDGRWFLVMEFIEQGSLAELIGRGERVSRQDATTWMRQALAGLAHAHRKGIVHRDIKPANLMFNGAGEVVVMDFGIARAETTPGLTSTGVTIGTPHYMSPEQITTPNRVDGRADIYSIGIVLYELLAGRKPFDSGSEFSILQAQVSEPPPPLRTIDPAIPPELEAVVMRALAKNPDDRFPDCDSMVRALDLVSQGASPDRLAGAPVAGPSGGTMLHSIYQPASGPQSVGPSSAELRERKRRAFRWRLLAAALVVIFGAALFAVNQTDRRPEKRAEGPHVPPQPTPPPAPPPDRPSDDKAEKGQERVPPGRNVGMAVVTPHDPIRDQPQLPISNVKPSTGPESRMPTPAPPPPLPSNPRVAVIGMGNDRMLAAALEQELERRFDELQVADEHGDPDIDDLLRRKDVTAKALGPALLKGGFHILVLVRAEEGDERTFTLQGQSASIKAARLRLNAYLLPANRTIGPGWTELVEYTELSLAAKVKMSLIGPTADLREAIPRDWDQLRAANGAATGRLP